MTDLRKVSLTFFILLLTLCTVGCISVAVPPEGGMDSTAQTDVKTEPNTQAVTETTPDAQTTEPASEQTTEPVTDPPVETTEEETTFGELHFPESGE